MSFFVATHSNDGIVSRVAAASAFFWLSEPVRLETRAEAEVRLEASGAKKKKRKIEKKRGQEKQVYFVLGGRGIRLW